MRLTFHAVVLVLSVISVACTHRSPVTPAGASAAQDSSPNYAIQQAYRDSVERATLGRFLTEYQQRARPFQQAGNYLGEMQLVREIAAKYPAG